MTKRIRRCPKRPSAAAHAVAAVEAPVAGAVPDGDRSASVAGRRVTHEGGRCLIEHADALGVVEPQSVALPLSDGDDVSDAVIEPLPQPVTLSVPVALTLADSEPDCEREPEPHAVALCDAVAHSVGEPLWLGDVDTLAVVDHVRLPEPDESTFVTDGHAESDGDALDEPHRLTVGVIEPE